MQWSFVFHLLGIIFWAGGLLILTRFARVLVNAEARSPEFVSTIRKTWFIYVLHGMVFTLLTGFYQLFAGGVGVYMKQGWFHGKLTLVLILLIATVLFALEVRRIGEGDAPRSGRLRAVQILTALSVVGIIVFTRALRF